MCCDYRYSRYRSASDSSVVLAMAICSLWLIASFAPARSANDYFHMGADRYIDDAVEDAREIVDEGLRIFINNPKLLALKELLEQQEQEDTDQQDESEPENDDSNDGRDDGTDSEDAEDDLEQTDDSDDEEDEGDRDPEPDSDEQPSPDEHAMEDIMRLLEALEQDERAYRDELRFIYGDPAEVEKDW